MEGALVTKRGAHIILKGVDYLLERNDPIMRSSPRINDILASVGLNQDFMYAIQLIDEEFNVLNSEQGIARIVEFEHKTSGGIIAHAYKLERTYSLTGKFANFYAPNTYLRVATCAPTSVMDFMSPGESVLVFRKGGHIDSVEIPEHSVLGREDGEIVPISYSELMMHFPYAEIPRIITEMENQLKLKTRRLDLTTSDATVSAPIFRLAPESYSDTSKPTPQQGMIIYNSDNQCLEFYDGKEWRTLVWQ
jgi:hypothetical protein